MRQTNTHRQTVKHFHLYHCCCCCSLCCCFCCCCCCVGCRCDLLKQCQSPLSKGCFSWSLAPNYRELIDTYRQRYEELQEYSQCVLDDGSAMGLSWKIHILVVHLPEWLDANAVGMAKFSEQTCEATHHDFEATHKRFKRAVGHADHGKNLRRSCVEYSSRRI